MERAAARFWGSYTRAVHVNGWVAGGRGAPAQVWLALRANHKATDPGLWDNLVAGGLGHGEGVADALKREAFEEAGLRIEEALECVPVSPLLINRPVEQGWQRELLAVFDACLLPQWRPRNQDGEVQAFECVSCLEAANRAAGRKMCADAALVTQEFLRRRGMAVV
jgi:8-oxo-dGTP pyrophosphatase MutT (NUDIX family)